MPHYILLHKPWGMLSQFTTGATAPAHTPTLSSLGLPARVYPVGRLDRDSEGLLLLSDDAALHTALAHPQRRQTKCYWVLVEGVPDNQKLEKLRAGVDIRVENKIYRTQPCQAKIIDPQPIIPERIPPVRTRKNIQDIWLEIIICEGKNRQIRKMTAAIGHPTLRLIRQRIAHLELGALPPGQWHTISRQQAWGTVVAQAPQPRPKVPNEVSGVWLTPAPKPAHPIAKIRPKPRKKPQKTTIAPPKRP